ncbi:hypothetical protein FIC_01376 [Flavobacteriaceae bacterium 3519-10]|nr:hypothetical protein FIC_01376 [Flavobacteriaceae bacterium 3519-10]
MLQMMQKSGHAWKEKAISELFGPLCFQLSRTQSAFNRYKAKNLFLEAEVLKNSNQKIRDLLLEKSYLIPPDLTEHAKNLVEHYDVWLEEFNRLREGENQAQDKNFVFVGPKGFPFPKTAEKKFREKYEELWQAMYQY